MFWLFEKYKDFIQQTDMSAKEFRLKKVPEQTKYELSNENEFNCLINWDKISPHYSFFFDFEGSEKEIQDRLEISELVLFENLFVETTSDNNIIRVPTKHFIKHWNEYIQSNQGMGSLITTTDFKLCIEFTDDYRYFLFSNFKI